MRLWVGVVARDPQWVARLVRRFSPETKVVIIGGEDDAARAEEEAGAWEKVVLVAAAPPRGALPRGVRNLLARAHVVLVV